MGKPGKGPPWRRGRGFGRDLEVWSVSAEGGHPHGGVWNCRVKV